MFIQINPYVCHYLTCYQSNISIIYERCVRKRVCLTRFAALFMLCILSASMSTLSSQFHTMGASVGSDIYGTYKPRSRGKLTNVIRLGVLFSILVSYIICYMLPNDIIARGTSIFMGICAAAFLPAYFCALYWRRATRQGVMASLWIGTIGSLFALAFLHQKEAAAMGYAGGFSVRMC